MSEDDKRRAFERYLALLIANRRNLPMAPDPELGEELPSREMIRVPRKRRPRARQRRIH